MKVLDTLLMKGELIEVPGNTIKGTIRTIRVIERNKEDKCGGIGLILNASGASPDTTLIIVQQAYRNQEVVVNRYCVF
jgi:hypothetical protein